MECHTRVLITAHMCVCPKLVVQSERYPIDRLNIAINHMYIMISPICRRQQAMQNKKWPTYGKKQTVPIWAASKKKTRKTSRKNITRVVLPRKDGSFETEMQVARFDDGVAVW